MNYFVLVISLLALISLQSCMTLISAGYNTAVANRNAKIQKMSELENRAMLNKKIQMYQLSKEDWNAAAELASQLNADNHIAYSKYNLALMYVAQDSIEDSRFAISSALAATPDDPNLQNAKKLLVRYDSLSKLGVKQNANTHYEMGLIKLQLQLPERAKEEFTKAIQINSKFDSAYMYRAYSIATEYEDSKKGVSIGASQFIAVKLDSVKQQQDIALLKNDCEYFQSKNPDNVNTFVYQSMAYNAIGKRVEAIQTLKNASEKFPNNADISEQKAFLFFQNKQFDLAELEYTNALNSFPQDIGRILYSRSIVREKLNKLAEAKEDIERFIKSSPTDKAYLQKALINFEMNNKTEAKEDFLRSAALQEQQGKNSEQSKRFANLVDAISDLDAQIIRNPKDAKSFVERGQKYFWLKHYVAANHDLTQAIGLNNKDAEAYNLRGLIRHEQEEFKSAIEDFSESINLREDKFVYYHRFLSRRALGDQKTEECSDLKAAIKLGYSEVTRLTEFLCGK